MHYNGIEIPLQRIQEYCKSRQIQELALFGSVLTKEFSAHSDIDVLVTFGPDSKYSLLDLATIKSDLDGIFGRDVDLVEKAALKNPFRRQAILGSMEVIYEA